MSSNYNTFGNTRDRGEGFLWADPGNDRLIILPYGNYGVPVYVPNYSYFHSMASRPMEKFVGVTYSTVPTVYQWHSFQAKGVQPPLQQYTGYGQITGNATPITKNYPYQISWSDDGTETGVFAVTCVSNQTDLVNDFYTSNSAGGAWTKQSTIPAGINFRPSPAVYGDGLWRFIYIGTTKLATSADNGASWTITDLNSTMGITNSLFGIAYGNGYWAIANWDNVLYTTDTSSVSPTWTGNSGHLAYGISYNAVTGNWWIGGGDFNGSYYTGKIERALNPNSWSPVYSNSPAAQMFVTSVVENNRGHVIGIGNDYSGGQFNNQRNYVYSTNGGSTWTVSTIDVAATVPLGTVPIAWASTENIPTNRGTSTVWPNPIPPGGSLSGVIDELFSTKLYVGNQTDRTITNGINLSAEGGLVWIKERNNTGNHFVFDTERTLGYSMQTNEQEDQSLRPETVEAYNTDGFDLGTGTNCNETGQDFVSWTFRKCPKFFDIITWTGDSNLQKVLSHNLGSAPGMVLIKSTNTNGTSWWAWHRSFGANTSEVGKQMALDSMKMTRDTGTIYSGSTHNWMAAGGAYQQGSYLQGTSSSNITVGTEANNNTWEYVAYLFAHNDGDGGFGDNSDQDIIKCGSYIGNGLLNGPTINIGWQPQWILIKKIASGDTGNWFIFDSARGVITDGDDQYLAPNTQDAEASWPGQNINFNPYGFKITQTGNNGLNNGGIEHIYMAIRY